MGNYATTSELQGRFANTEEVAYLTDTEGTGTPSSTVLDDCIESAEADINSRIGKRYATPVSVSGNVELTALMKRKTLDLAEYYLLMRGPSISEAKQKQADRVFEWAEKVSDGEFVLSGASTPESTRSKNPLSQWSGGNRVLAADSPRNASREAGYGL